MDWNTVLADMNAIALLQERPAETTSFSGLNVDERVIRHGCIKILGWLRIQAAAANTRLLQLEPRSSLDGACMTLVRNAISVQMLVRIEDNVLSLA